MTSVPKGTALVMGLKLPSSNSRLTIPTSLLISTSWKFLKGRKEEKYNVKGRTDKIKVRVIMKQRINDKFVNR